MNLEDELKDALQTKTLKKISGKGGGGCINQGECYAVDDDKLIFVKLCTKPNASEIIAGEFASLRALKATNCVRVPDPMAIVEEPDSDRVALAMEFVEMQQLKQQAKLGEQLANLHLNNEKLQQSREYKNNYVGQSVNNDEKSIAVDQFGFDCVTCCGAIAMNNEWCDDWVSFFARNRLQHQINLIQENYQDRQVTELWAELQLKLPNFFRVFVEEEIEIKPSLLHGDLWWVVVGHIWTWLTELYTKLGPEMRRKLVMSQSSSTRVASTVSWIDFEQD